MTDTSTDSTDTETTTSASGLASRALDYLLLAMAVTVFVAEPVAAQSAAEAICNNKTMKTAFSGGLSLLTVIGVVLALVAYKYQYVVGIISMNPKHQEKMKQRKQMIKKSAAGLVLIDALYLVAAPMMGLPQFGCLFS